MTDTTTTSTTNAITTNASTTNASTTTDSPTTDSPTTDSPTTDSPTTDSPTTDSPTTDSPTTDSPTTDSTTTASTGGSAVGGPVRRALRPSLLPGAVFALELRRLVRNRRTVVLTLVMPSLLFLLLGSGSGPRNATVGHGNATAYVMVGLEVYASMVATTSTGAGVSLDRAAGWSRQLRLSPLRPLSYVVLKAAVAMVAGAAASGLVLFVGGLRGAQMPPERWVACGLLAWTCSSVFAALGLAVGYLLPGESAMQLLGPLLGLMSFAGGLFIPVDTFGPTFAAVARWSPTWGVGELARWPLAGSDHVWAALVNTVAWTCVFLGLAAWRFRRDTRRA